MCDKVRNFGTFVGGDAQGLAVNFHPNVRSCRRNVLVLSRFVTVGLERMRLGEENLLPHFAAFRNIYAGWTRTKGA